MGLAEDLGLESVPDRIQEIGERGIVGRRIGGVAGGTDLPQLGEIFMQRRGHGG